MLEELAISLKHNLVSKLPFCAFNGGNDVFVDVGNKSLGLDALMRYLDAYPYEVRETQGFFWGGYRLLGTSGTRQRDTRTNTHTRRGHGTTLAVPRLHSLCCSLPCVARRSACAGAARG